MKLAKMASLSNLLNRHEKEPSVASSQQTDVIDISPAKHSKENVPPFTAKTQASFSLRTPPPAQASTKNKDGLLHPPQSKSAFFKFPSSNGKSNKGSVSTMRISRPQPSPYCTDPVFKEPGLPASYTNARRAPTPPDDYFSYQAGQRAESFDVPRTTYPQLSLTQANAAPRLTTSRSSPALSTQRRVLVRTEPLRPKRTDPDVPTDELDDMSSFEDDLAESTFDPSTSLYEDVYSFMDLPGCRVGEAGLLMLRNSPSGKGVSQKYSFDQVSFGADNWILSSKYCI